MKKKRREGEMLELILFGVTIACFVWLLGFCSFVFGEIHGERKTLLSILEELEKNDKENTTKTREEYGNRKEDR